eukprot:ANDGO_04458.mRNA.1 Tyrosyl-DNA phosphodiesterase 1
MEPLPKKFKGSSAADGPQNQHKDRRGIEFDGTSLFMNKPVFLADSDCPGHLPIRSVVQSRNLEFALVTAMIVDEDFVRKLVGNTCNLVIVTDPGENQDARQNGLSVKTSDNTTIIMPPIRTGKWGFMHAKLFMLEYGDFMRIIISSANLGVADFALVGQCFWICDVPARSLAVPSSSMSTAKSAFCGLPKFVLDLKWFVQSLKVGIQDIARLFDSDRYDFSVIPQDIALIHSIPGFHKGDWMHRQGHLSLRKNLEPFHGVLNPDSVVCYQTSSVGLLDKAFQDQFARSIGIECSSLGNVFVLFPSKETVESTKSEGCEAFMCLNDKHWMHAQFPRDWFHDVIGPDAARDRILLHSKILFQVDRDTGLFWLYAGSANASPSAWGKFTSKNEDMFRVANYELGVLFLPSERRCQMGLQNWCSLPFKIPDAKSEISYTPFMFGAATD